MKKLEIGRASMNMGLTAPNTTSRPSAVFDGDFGFVVILNQKSGEFRQATAQEIESATTEQVKNAIAQTVAPYAFTTLNDIDASVAGEVQKYQAILVERGVEAQVMSESQIQDAIQSSSTLQERLSGPVRSSLDLVNYLTSTSVTQSKK